MIQGYAAMQAGNALQPYGYEPEDLEAHDVEIEITHCGVCHSDIHLIDDDLGISKFPLIPGHEIIGTIVGSGKRVGVGWQRGSCHTCSYCRVGNENLCAESRPTCVADPGGFAERIRVDGRFAFPIPDALASENAAPLLCAGVTVFSPLFCHVDSSMRVGILGIGGLGHLALQFASALGCEVVAISHSADKKEEALGFGADHFLSTDSLGGATGSLDFILSTINVGADWRSYLSLLRPEGKLCFVGLSSEPISCGAVDLIVGQKSLVGSAIGGSVDMQRMLEFAARHSIVAKTELYPMSEVNRAIERVRRNEVRYRAVLVRE